MIGFAGLFTEIIFPASIFTALVGVLIYHSRSVYRASGSWAVIGLFCAWTVLCALMTVHAVREIRFHRDLEDLKPELIEAIVINHVNITSAEQITKITTALRDWQWFAPHGDREADEVPLQIKFKSGNEYSCKIGMYLTEEGVVVSKAGSTGRVFYREMPAILDSMHIALPQCQSIGVRRPCSVNTR